METPKAKLLELKSVLADLGGVLVAFSGGVDSTFLLKAAQETLGDQVLAVTVRTGLTPDSEIAAAEAIAVHLQAKHNIVPVDVLSDRAIAANPTNRCYLCKRAIFSELQGFAAAHGLQVIDGSNYDDLGEHRPGLGALAELGVRSPLAEVGLTKAEIRALSREAQLPTWDAPASPCLATRLPYGESLTAEKLRRVAEAEEFLRSLGFGVVRVRTHGSLARIEVPIPKRACLVAEMAPAIVGKLEALGYTHVSLDLRGYRTGSMDETRGIRSDDERDP